MQSTLKMTLVAAILSISSAVPVMDDPMEEQTQCEADAQQTYY